MTKEEIDRLKKDAFVYVSKAANWIISLANQEKYIDDYILAITRGKNFDRGVMPVAEIIMCLFNLMEYKEIGIPQPDSTIMNKQIKNLLIRYNRDGFSGFPYFRANDMAIDPPFNDAVNFMVAAINQAYRYDQIDSELKIQCEKVLLLCLDWLLDSAIEMNDNSIAWGWTSPQEIKKNQEFNKLFFNTIPPQTYFTSNTIISLLEVLFDNYDLLEQNLKIEKTYKTIIGAKKFLLTSIMKGRSVGWSDINPKFSSNFPVKNLYSKDPDINISLYPLESLSYFRFYIKNLDYSGTNKKLETAYPELYKEFNDFQAARETELDFVFYSASQELTEKEHPEELQAKIQIPENFNKIPGTDKAYYYDGTVIYNCLNSLNFYNKCFGIDEKEYETEWENSQVNLINSILLKSFQGNGFLHCGDGSEHNPQVISIYATRAAIACLLSYKVIPPERRIGIYSDEVLEVASKLLEFIKSQALAKPSENIQEKDLTDLMSIAFIIGMILKHLKERQKISFPNLYDEGNVSNTGTVVYANGLKLISTLSKICIGTEEEVYQEISFMLEQEGLLKPIEKVFTRFIEKKESKELILSQILGELIGVIENDSNLNAVKDIYSPKSN